MKSLWQGETIKSKFNHSQLGIWLSSERILKLVCFDHATCGIHLRVPSVGTASRGVPATLESA